MPSVKDRTLVNFTVFMLVNVTVFMPIFTSFYPFLGIDIIDILIYILYVYYELFRILPMTLYKTLFPISPPPSPCDRLPAGKEGGGEGRGRSFVLGAGKVGQKIPSDGLTPGGRGERERKFCFLGG